MNHATDHGFHQDQPRPFWARPAVLAVATVVLILAFYLLREHWGHALGMWPYLILLACPLMHLFHRHGGHADNPPRQDQRERA